MLEVAPKEGAVNVYLVGQLLVAADPSRNGGAAYPSARAVCSVSRQNHFAVAPCQVGGEQRNNFYISQFGEPSRKLHRVGGYEVGRVDAAWLTLSSSSAISGDMLLVILATEL